MAAIPGDDALFRRTAVGREPLAAPQQSGFHVHVAVHRRVGVGVITSVRATGPVVACRMTDFEYLSLISGIPVAELLRRQSSGKRDLNYDGEPPGVVAG